MRETEAGDLKIDSCLTAPPSEDGSCEHWWRERLRGVGLEILWDLDALQRDPATAELIRSGRTMGCFYIESPSMRSLFQRMRCDCYEDVVAASSIIRPGVAESGMMKAYVERHRKARIQRREARSERELTTDNRQLTTNNPQSAFAKASADKSAIEYLHPKLAELLAETYGVMVYQEDVIKVVHALGGLSLGEADVLRRAMSAKLGAQEAMESLTERFFAGCRARGVSEPVIEELWRQIETFARFSFCKGHSAAFAVLSYQVAYLKAHHPAEFMAAVLSNGGGFYGAAAYIQECRRMGLRVLGPDINESQVDYTGKTYNPPYGGQLTTDNRQLTTDNQPPATGWVRVGFGAIKNFPLDLAERIVRIRQERPFGPEGPEAPPTQYGLSGEASTALEDFLRRVRPGREAAEKLIQVGAFDRIGLSPKGASPRERLFLELDIYFRAQTTDANGQLVLGWNRTARRLRGKVADERREAGSERSKLNPKLETRNPKHSSFRLPPFELARRVADEIELLGYGVSAHPLELLPDDIWRGTVAACDLGRHIRRRVTMIGWVIAAKLVRTHQSREFMKFLSLEDLTGTFEVTLFPRAYRRFAPLTLGPGPYRVRGKIEDDQGALSIVADHIETLPSTHLDTDDSTGFPIDADPEQVV